MIASYNSTVKLILHRLTRVLLVVLVFLTSLPGAPTPSRAESQEIPDTCHFGIALAGSPTGYDLTTLGVDALVNWSVGPPASLPANIQHTKIVRVRDDLYATTLDTLDNWVSVFPGAVWIIGNEPDVYYIQDELHPEVYAARYFELASLIRSQDPSAKIGFGPVAQMTPLRRQYLDMVLDELTTSYTGSMTETLGLIDIFTPHAFLVNEGYGMWGAGIPPGLEMPDPYEDPPGAFKIDIVSEITKTYSITLFSQFVVDFRTWMKDMGAQDKPLWITEYGSLMPPIDPPGGPDYYNVSDEATRDYMRATFDFILGNKQADIGYAPDDYRLVQRGYWYSLNEVRWVYGGSLYDPFTQQRTIVGDDYVTYDPPAGSVSLVNPDAYPESTWLNFLGLSPGSNGTMGDYIFNVRIGNSVISDLRPRVTVELRDASTNALIDSGPATLARCGGQAVVSLEWFNVIFNQPYDLLVRVLVDAGSGVDLIPANNDLPISITRGDPYFVSLPTVLVR